MKHLKNKLTQKLRLTEFEKNTKVHQKKLIYIYIYIFCWHILFVVIIYIILQHSPEICIHVN